LISIIYNLYLTTYNLTNNFWSDLHNINMKSQYKN
jgi:hypothetical protein